MLHKHLPKWIAAAAATFACAALPPRRPPPIPTSPSG